jgi:hypothetical protein
MDKCPHEEMGQKEKIKSRVHTASYLRIIITGKLTR